MKSISLAIVCYFEKDIADFGYHYQGVFYPQITLLAYTIDDEEIPHIIDLTIEKRLPNKVFAALRNPKIIKYTYNSDFTRECLVRNFNYNFPSENWKPLYPVVSYLRLPDTLEELSILFKLKILDFAHIDYCKKIFCHPHTICNKHIRIYPSEYPILWKKLQEYCKWMVETECLIRKLLFIFPCSDLCLLTSALQTKISKQGIPIYSKKWQELQNNFSIKLNNLCSEYELIKNNCLLYSNLENYKQLLNQTSEIEHYLKTNYAELKNGVSELSRYHTPFTNSALSDIPRILYDIVIPSENDLLAWIDFSPNYKTITAKLFEDLCAIEQLLRAIKYVLYTKSSYTLNNLTLKYYANCLCIYSEYDSVVTYPNVSITNDNQVLFKYYGYNTYHQWDEISCTLDSLIDDIATAIQTNIIVTYALQYESILFDTVSLSQYSILLNVPHNNETIIQEVFKQCLIQTRT